MPKRWKAVSEKIWLRVSGLVLSSAFDQIWGGVSLNAIGLACEKDDGGGLREGS